MRKSTLLISAMLTAFTLALLVGTASAYREITSLKEPDIAAAKSSGIQGVSDVALPDPTSAALLSAEQAADLAAQVLNRTDLYSVETTEFEGVQAYLVTFSSGDLVYVGLDGKILSVSEIPVTIVSQASAGRRRGDGGGGGGEHEDHEDHEAEVEHDD